MKNAYHFIRHDNCNSPKKRKLNKCHIALLGDVDYNNEMLRVQLTFNLPYAGFRMSNCYMLKAHGGQVLNDEQCYETCNRLDSETLGSRPIMSQILLMGNWIAI